MNKHEHSMYSSTDLRSLMTTLGLRTPMAHRVEWWPFGTVIRRARLDIGYKAMYIGGAKAIVLGDHYSEVIEVNPDDWVSVPETTP